MLTQSEITTLLTPPEPKVNLSPEISTNQKDWRNHPKVHRWTRQNGIINEFDMVRWEKKIQEDPTIQMFGLVNERREEVGTCGLTSISSVHGSAEFSLLIGPEHQRKGYGRLGLIELFRYGFKHLRLHCIWGETFVENPAFLLFMRLGMKKDGKLRQRYFKNGKYVDAYAISILETEARRQPWFQSYLYP